MNTAPRVSVIMPAYNAAQFIAEAVLSVIRQQFQAWELIVVDDGSTDSTGDIIQQFSQEDPRIQYVYQANSRQGKARNAGISIAKGELLAFLDADDLWLPEKLDMQLACLEARGADLVFSDVTVIDKNGLLLRNSWNVTETVYSGIDGLAKLLNSNIIPLVSVLVKKDLVLRSGGFREHFAVQYGEDYDLWLRLLINGAVFRSVGDKLAQYRMHPLQATSNKMAILQIVQHISSLPDAGHVINKLKKRAIIKRIRNWLRHTQTTDKQAMEQALNYFPYRFTRLAVLLAARVLNGSTLRLFFDKACSLSLLK